MLFVAVGPVLPVHVLLSADMLLSAHMLLPACMLLSADLLVSASLLSQRVLLTLLGSGVRTVTLRSRRLRGFQPRRIRI